MKKIKLFSLFAAILFAGSAMAATYFYSPYSNPKNHTAFLVNLADPTNEDDRIALVGASCNNGSKDITSNPTSIVDGVSTITADSDGKLYYIKLASNSSFTFSIAKKSNFSVVFTSPSKDGSLVLSSIASDNTETAIKTVAANSKLAIFTLSNELAAGNYKLASSNKEMDIFEILLVEAASTDDATLKSITINDEEVEGFAPETTTYNVALPFGTTDVPFVAATATSSNAKVSVTQAESVDGTATITVTAEDETTTQTYTINFTVATCAFAELALSVNSIGAIIETEDLVAPTLTNPHNLSVVYASSNKEVVTVDQTGALTKVGVGEAVITITAAKQTVEGIEYCEDEVSYKVTLTAHPIEGSTTIFEWVVASSNLTEPTEDSTSLDAANYGTLTIGQSVVNRYFGKNKFSVSSGMYKLGNNDVAVEFATEGGFLAEDEITIVGKNGGTGDRGFEIGNASAKGAGTKGNIASSTQSTETPNSTYTAVVVRQGKEACCVYSA